MSRSVAPHFDTHSPTCTLKQSQSKESTCVTLSIKYSIYIMVPYQICTWSGSCHVSPVPVPLFDVAENRSLYSYRPSLLRDLHGCESEVQMAENEDNDVAAFDNDVLL